MQPIDAENIIDPREQDQSEFRNLLQVNQLQNLTSLGYPCQNENLEIICDKHGKQFLVYFCARNLIFIDCETNEITKTDILDSLKRDLSKNISSICRINEKVLLIGEEGADSDIFSYDCDEKTVKFLSGLNSKGFFSLSYQ